MVLRFWEKDNICLIDPFKIGWLWDDIIAKIDHVLSNYVPKILGKH